MTGAVARRSWRRSVASALLVVVFTGGCTTGDGAPAGDADSVGADGAVAAAGDGEVDADIRLVVGDNHVREEGVECAGARPFNHVRAGAPFTIEDPDGDVLVEGRLPAGESFNADPSIDWGVERIPTICVLEFRVTGLPDLPSYQLQLPQGSPLGFEADEITEDEPVLLLLG